MNSITIRQAVLADLDVVAGLFDGYRQFYDQVSDLQAARNFLQARFEHGQSVILLAESQGQAVGFTQCTRAFRPCRWRGFMCSTIYMSRHPQGEGVWASDC